MSCRVALRRERRVCCDGGAGLEVEDEAATESNEDERKEGGGKGERYGAKMRERNAGRVECAPRIRMAFKRSGTSRLSLTCGEEDRVKSCAPSLSPGPATYNLCEVFPCSLVFPAQFALYAVLMPAFGCGPFRVVEDEFDDGDRDLSAGRDRFGWRTRRRQGVARRCGASLLCWQWFGGSSRFGRCRDERTSDDDGRDRYILRSEEASGVICWSRSAIAWLRSRLCLLRFVPR